EGRWRKSSGSERRGWQTAKHAGIERLASPDGCLISPFMPAPHGALKRSEGGSTFKGASGHTRHFFSLASLKEERAGVRSQCLQARSPRPSPLPVWAGRGSCFRLVRVSSCTQPSTAFH